jgi:hypothetical protein
VVEFLGGRGLLGWGEQRRAREGREDVVLCILSGRICGLNVARDVYDGDEVYNPYLKQTIADKAPHF